MMIIELTMMSFAFMLVGAGFGYNIGKSKDHANIQLPDWLTGTFRK